MVNHPKRSKRRNNTARFDVSLRDAEIIQKISDRAVKIWPHWNRLTCVMDVTACHANGNPLKLLSLLEADDFNFMHDVGGITKHIEREGGTLTGFFLPRYHA